AVPRRVPLWPETVAALKVAVRDRPKAKDAAHDGLVFITKYGQPWTSRIRQAANLSTDSSPLVERPPLASTDSPITKELAELMESLEMERPEVNFYALRHTFETIGGESRDQLAVDAMPSASAAGPSRQQITAAGAAAVSLATKPSGRGVFDR